MEDLELEVMCGKCHLRFEPTSDKVVRTVQVVMLQLQRLDGAILLEGALLRQDDDCFSYTPVREIAETLKQSAATGIIYGLALGYLSW